ncbi:MULTISPECIES: hypothetical protein [unclassified Streptomyces]|uniref:hypothetical protein n=1 Tax=unclassified Streptomyces TaxID=2593676 RepID=UPI00382CC8DD
MARGGRRTAEEIADGIALVCENVEGIRAKLERGPADDLRQLDELLTALHDGTDPADLLETVHRALRRAQDAMGVFGRVRDASMVTVAGIPIVPGESVLLCPRAEHPCARYAWPGPESRPVCHVTGSSLRRTTLTT